MKNTNKSRTFEYTVTDEDEGSRVKDILSKKGNYSRREVTSLNANHGIFLNGETVRLSETVKAGDRIKAQMSDLEANRHGILPDTLEILYEDNDLILINKPAGLSVHATKEHEKDHIGTLLKKHLGSDYIVRPAGRLDKDVSGVMCYAKSKEAAAALERQRLEDTEHHNFHKVYYAVIHGFMDKKEGTLKYRLEKGNDKAQHISENGRLCITDYKVLKEMKDTSFVEVSIRTGRNHQIRAGFSGLGHPLVGDRLYGGTTRIARPALHCGKLTLKQPFTHRTIHVEAPLPEDMENLLHEK